MALLAGLREIRRDVVRIVRALEILQVTGHACRAVQCEVIVNVAIGALARRHCVRAGQHEPGAGVVELPIRPLHGIVAVFARCRETTVRYRGGRATEIFLVASDARQSAEGVIVVDVAVRALAGRNCVASAQNKSGRAMVETRDVSV